MAAVQIARTLSRSPMGVGKGDARTQIWNEPSVRRSIDTTMVASLDGLCEVVQDDTPCPESKSPLEKVGLYQNKPDYAFEQYFGIDFLCKS